MPPVSPEEKRFFARMTDLAEKADRTGCAVFTPFLDLRQRELALQAVSGVITRPILYGGYPEAERVMVGLSPYGSMEETEFPLLSLDFTVHGEFDHRDVLGSILGLGLERDRVGDILLFEGGFRVFVAEKTADFVTGQLTRIGRGLATFTPGAGDGVAVGPRFEQRSDTLASSRLDCVVAAIANCSRSEAMERIERGTVEVNHRTVLKATAQPEAGDVLSVRGKGKFRVDDLSGVTKKGRIVLKYSKYL